MCGIAATVGREESPERVKRALVELRIRGSDSWGIAAMNGGNPPFEVVKKVGNIGDHSERSIALPNSVSFLAHTRWATHGGATEQNAHPHFDSTGKIAVVHNGCVLNEHEVRQRLLRLDHKFTSTTDTALIPHLIEETMGKGKMSFLDAVRLTAKQLDGESSFVAAHSELRQVVAVRNGNPLYIGVCQNTGTFFIASDTIAFPQYTNMTIPINNGEIASFDANKLDQSPQLIRLDSGKPLPKSTVQLNRVVATGDGKGSHRHYMLKEIMEQDVTIAGAVKQDAQQVKEISKSIRDASEVYLVGCGTTAKVCRAGEVMFSSIAGIKSRAWEASEFSGARNIGPNTLVVPVSQSGTTADTLEAIGLARAKGAKVISLLNVEGSTMSGVSDSHLLINAGRERAVASTKATTAQLSLLGLIAYSCADRFEDGRKAVLGMASAAREILNPEYLKQVNKLAEIVESKREISKSDNLILMARGQLNIAVMNEGVIKFIEVCYKPTLAYPAGELMHGPLALVTEGTPCIAFVPNDHTKPKILNDIQKVKARYGWVIGLSPQNNEAFDYWLRTPDVGELSPILSLLPIQLLAYHMAILRGNNPDDPRNLAKSVTVI